MDEPRQPYRTFRLKSDLSMKLEEILQVLDVKSTDYLDPLVRQQIENDHRAHGRAIRLLRDAREARRKADETEDAAELGDPVA